MKLQFEVGITFMIRVRKVNENIQTSVRQDNYGVINNPFGLQGEFNHEEVGRHRYRVKNKD